MSLAVIIEHTNWRGERRERRVRPLRIAYMASQWHKAEQWILIAHDLDIDEEREFAVSDIHSWKPAD